MRLADYIAQTLAERGVRDVFLVTGGGAMHLNDAVGRESRLRYVCCHHEQACAMAAEGYARVSNRLAVVSVTSGPGGVNALNGVFGAWTDSIPMLVISGQMKRETLVGAYGLTGKLRQLGDQEVDIIQMVRGITKYSEIILDPSTIRYHLEKALFLARSGRPGPCWLDVPVDVQAAAVEPDEMKAYDPAEDAVSFDPERLRQQAMEVGRRLGEASRPVFLIGTGVRLAGAAESFLELAERLHIPVVTAWTHDLIASDHPLFCGRQGTIGTRAGNFTVQNADLLVIIGSRMCIRQISYNWQSFARHAFTVQVDVDVAEFEKPTFRANLPIHADARLFVENLAGAVPAEYLPPPSHRTWVEWCRERVRKYPNVLPKHHTSAPGTLNPYHFIELLFEASRPGDIFACGDATACITPFQAGHLKERQRLFSNSGSASMGYDLPAAIGAACAASGERVICLAGDGSLQMNIQELATVAHHRMPIKLFVLCNGGYLSIRSTQSSFFKLLVGEGPASGVSFPDFVRVAKAYGIPAHRLDTARPAEDIAAALASPGPEVVVVELDQSQTFEPKLSSRRLPDGRMVTAPLEDMAPFLSRDELKSNMLVPLSDE